MKLSDINCGVYRHPYKRGLSLSIEREGWLSVRLLLWKWDFWANARNTVPAEQTVEGHYKQMVADEAKRRHLAEAIAEGFRGRVAELEKKYERDN